MVIKNILFKINKYWIQQYIRLYYNTLAEAWQLELVHIPLQKVWFLSLMAYQPLLII